MVIAAVVVVVIAVFGFMFFNERSKAESAKKYSGIEAKAAAARKRRIRYFRIRCLTLWQ